jgi:hypothetical protein
VVFNGIARGPDSVFPGNPASDFRRSGGAGCVRQQVAKLGAHALCRVSASVFNAQGPAASAAPLQSGFPMGGGIMIVSSGPEPRGSRSAAAWQEGRDGPIVSAG